jgi:CMP-N,N'-diacetyllegionaminic acid synthase
VRAAAVIPARAGSKGLVDKNALPVAGVPMIVRAIGAVRSAGQVVERLLVSTDSPTVARLAMEAGAEVVERPKELAGDTTGLDSAVRHALRKVYGRSGPFPEAAIVIQPNLPVWQPGIVGECLERLAQGDCTAAASCHLVDQRPEWMKRKNAAGFAEPFLPARNVPIYRQALPELYYLDGAVIAVRTDVLMATEGQPIGPYYYTGERLALVPRAELYGIEVHSPEDIAHAEIAIAWLEQSGYPQ